MADFSTMSTKELLTERKARWDEANEIVQKAKREGRDMLATDNERYDTLVDKVEKLDAAVNARRESTSRVDAHNRLAERLSDSAGRQSGFSRNLIDRSRNDLQVWMGQKQVSLSGESAPDWGDDGASAFAKLSQLGTAEYEQSFSRFITSGERLGMQVGVASKGGYLAPTTMLGNLIKFLDDTVIMRKLGSKFSLPNAASMGAVSWDTDPGDADWTAEVPASDLSEDNSATIGKRELIPHLITKLVKVSQQLMAASLLDLEGLLVQRLGYKFGVTEEKAFLLGTGSQQPLGVFTASNDGVPTSRDVLTVGSATAVDFDDLINLKGSVKQQYQQSGIFIVSRPLLTMLRKVKTTTYYSWQPSVQLGQPDMILGSPYYQSEYVPSTFTAGNYTAMFCDPSFYWIADSLELQIQRLTELFTLKNQIGLKAMKATDGMPVLAEAFARLKQKP